MEEENAIHTRINGQTKNNTFGGSLDDTECRQSKESLSNGNSPNPSRAGRNIPRRHTVGGPRSSKEILGMQTSDMDRKREAFLEHLKYKYPHHATAIMGHQERLRDQAVQGMLASLHSELDIQRYLMKIESSQRTKSPKLSSSPQPSLGDPAEHLSEVSVDSGEAMFEGESTAPFVRGSRTRASLPVVRSTNQTKERSLGVLFLQYGEDTKKLQMPNEITSVDTIRALFVSAFPQQLTMKVLESPSTAIYIKDEGRNIYYELSDVRNIQDRSFLKVYNKDPAHAFNHTPSAVNGDVRMQRDITYNVREGPVVHRPGSATYPSHGGPISPPPTPVPHSMPPSPSRIPYGGGRPPVGQSNTTMPRERLSSLPVSRSISPSPSAILERRDVKPDEDLGNKNVQLMRNDSMYADPYMYHEGRMSIASSHGGHPLDMPDHLIAYHRGAMRSSSTYSNTMQVEMMEQSVYRQKSRKHSDSHLPTLGSKTPPASPHRVTDIRMMEMHGHNAHGPPHGIHSERSSPIRQSFKKDQGPGVFVEAKVRNTGGILGMADIVPSPTDKQIYAAGYGPPKDNYTRERMHAMEKQIASLTGLVQNALFKGPSPSSNKDAPGEKVIRSASSTPPVTDSPGHSASSGKNTLTIIETTAVISQAPSAGSTDMQVSLHDMRRNVAELRLQLQKMRQLQLQNQEMVRAMMKKAEQEISSKMTEMVKNLEDPVQRQRVLVEQERQKYLQDEEQIVLKLSDLESFVEDMRKDSSATRIVTLKDVEDRAFVLRQIGEAVSNLKGEFPYLQNKMRAVLRVEVEAVRFLKEEPHKLDSLLKRIRSMTDALSALRRHVSDGSSKTVDYNQNNQYTITEKVTESETIQNKEKSQVYLQSAQTESGNTTESQKTSVKSEVVPLSVGVKVLHVQSSPVLMKQSQHSTVLVNHTYTSGNQSGLSAESSANHQSVSTSATPEQNATAQHTQLNGSSAQSLFIEEIQHVGYRNRAVSIEEAERKFEEKRQNLDHYDGKEFEKMLEEAQANIMKSIPSLEMPTQTSKAEIVEKLEVNEGGQESELENEKLTKSPPPPPPRRMYPLGSSLSSSWTSDWKDSKDAEDIPPPPPPKATKPEVESPIKTSQVKDEEEEEGERIMAELQAFQKCSVVEINSKVHYEPSKTEVQERDFRPSGLALPKEKKVSCLVSKESVSPESPKLVESTEDKWKSQSIASSAPDFAQFRQTEKVVVNEQSTYSLFIGRDEPRSTVRKEPEKEDKNEELVNMALYRYHNRENLKHLTSTVPEVINGGTDHKISESTSTLVKSSSIESQDSPVGSSPSQEQGMPYFDLGQTVVLRQKNSRRTTSQQSEDLESPTVSPTEPRSPADNIAFMITNTEVQVLSTGEVQDIVNRKGGEVQTVNVDSENVKIPSSNSDPQDPVMSTDKKPVIIIFDEPMDIRAAYKRLSTIFEECDDELEKMMSSEAKIDEEEEEEEEDHKESSAPPPKEEQAEETKMVNITENVVKQGKYRFNYPSLAEMKQTMFQDTGVSQGFLTDEEKSDASDYQDGQRQDAKKKFKFRFPKKQLAALTQAIRTGTKTGKKTLQVVVYEDEEEPDGTVKQHKEAKRFEIERSKSADDHIQLEVPNLEEPDSVSRTDEIRQNTYRTLDSLEQTIKQLESTISGMTPRPGSDFIESKDNNRTLTITPVVAKGSVLADDTKLVVESPSSIPTTARKGSNGAPQTSRMPIPMSSKTRQGSMEKTSKQPKLQEPQRQFRQANGGVKKAGGDIKAASPTLSASKIPALSPNTGKSSSVSAQCNETANPHNPPVKSHVPVTHSNSAPGRNVNASSSLIRPVHNGTSKLQSPTYSGKGHHLSFSLQNANGRPSPPPSSSSSSATSSPPSSVSPTSLAQSMKSIRTIHTPSFTSYKSQNGSATKMAAPKDSS